LEIHSWCHSYQLVQLFRELHISLFVLEKHRDYTDLVINSVRKPVQKCHIPEELEASVDHFTHINYLWDIKGFLEIAWTVDLAWVTTRTANLGWVAIYLFGKCFQASTPTFIIAQCSASRSNTTVVTTTLLVEHLGRL